MSSCLKSGLAPAIRSMIDYKVSLGYEESTYLPRSHSLDRYCTEHFPDETSLTREVVTGWLERHPGESIGYFHSRAGYARGLGKYLASMGIPAFILPEKFTSGRSCFLPYIFTDSELKELFHVIDAQGSRENSLQPFLLSTVFRLIYTCGLRPNEGRMLKRESVNLATGEILITETKGHKERIVVMSDDMTELAASYARLRDAAYPDSPYFFPDRNGNSYSSPWMQNKFKAFLPLQIPVSIRTCSHQSGYMTCATALPPQHWDAGLTTGKIFSTGCLTCGHTWGIRNCPQPCTISISFRKTS